jgi:hypothetical protein
LPYNISKGINWQSGDDLEYRLEEYEMGEYGQNSPKNEFAEKLLIPLVLVIVAVTALCIFIHDTWRKMKRQSLIPD